MISLIAVLNNRAQGFKLLYNPPGGGNCQFAVLLHQAKRMGILRSPEKK